MGARQNEDRDGCISQTLTASTVATQGTTEYTFTVLGLRTGDMVFVNKPTAQSGLGIVNCRVSANDTLAITYLNTLLSTAITPTAEAYTIYWRRPERTASSVIA